MKGEIHGNSSCSCDRGEFCGKGCGRGQGIGGDKEGSNDERHNKVEFHYHYYKKLGHKEANCWQKQKDEANKASFPEKTKEDRKLFYGHLF